MNEKVTSGSKDIDKEWKLAGLGLFCRSFYPPVTTGFIQASLSKIQGFFKDFIQASLSKIQGLFKDF